MGGRSGWSRSQRSRSRSPLSSASSWRFLCSRQRRTATPQLLERYRSRIRAPVLDRIVTNVEVPALSLQELKSRPASEASAAVAEWYGRRAVGASGHPPGGDLDLGELAGGPRPGREAARGRGQAKQMAARLMSLGEGRQTL